MGKTSAKSVDAWKRRNYDSILVYVPKGQKAAFKAACESENVSMNKVISTFISDFIDMHTKTLS